MLSRERVILNAEIRVGGLIAGKLTTLEREMKNRLSGYASLVIVSALIGAGIAVTLAYFGVSGPAVDGGIGFGVILWVSAWATFRLDASAQKNC